MTALAVLPASARWRDWSCDVVVQTSGTTDLEGVETALRQVMRDVEEVASRFRDDSDLARVNATPGRWVRVDPLLVEAVRVALAAAAATDGLVHPLLGRSLVDLGYDRTIGELRDRGTSRGLPARAPALDAWREVDLTEDAVRIPAGTALDLGATAKAWAVDLAIAAATEVVTGPALLGIGGDLRTVGDAAWTVVVSEGGPEEIAGEGPATALVEMTGAIATSGTRVRRWRAGAVERHHLLDPRTGLPVAADAPWHTASVVAPTCVAANTATTAAIVLGAAAPDWLVGRGLPARLAGEVAGRRVVRTLGGWPDDADPTSAPQETR